MERIAFDAIDRQDAADLRELAESCDCACEIAASGLWWSRKHMVTISGPADAMAAFRERRAAQAEENAWWFAIR
jgi:hypothetical protein